MGQTALRGGGLTALTHMVRWVGCDSGERKWVRSPLLFDIEERMRRYADIGFLAVIVVLMVTLAIWWTPIYGVDPTDLWIPIGLGLCVLRFIGLNYIFNKWALKAADNRNLASPGQWFILNPDKLGLGFDHFYGIAIISFPGMIVFILLLLSFVASIYAAVNPEILAGGVDSKVVFAGGLACLVLLIAIVFAKGRFAKL